jgi:PAS domain S-box-containing protein
MIEDSDFCPSQTFGSDEMMNVHPHFSYCIHPADQVAIIEAFASLREDVGMTRLRIRIRRGQDSWQVVRCIARVLPGTDRICLIDLDNDSPRESEREAARLQCILNQTETEIFVLTRHGVIDYVNTAAARSVGRHVAELQGAHFHLIDPDFDCSEDSDIVRGIEATGVYRCQASFLHASGRPLSREVCVTRMTFENDEFLCVSAHESPNPASNGRTLDPGERRFRDLADRSDDLIYSYRLYPERGFDYVNPAATAITGYTPEEHYADPDLGKKLIHPDDALKLATLLREPQSEAPSQLRWVKKDGTVIWTEQMNTLIKDESGRLVGIEGIARDMTRRKQSEEEILKANSTLETLAEARRRELDYASQELETLLYSVAHDLRAPLRHIEGYLGLLRSELADATCSGTARAYLDTLERTAARLSSQFDALLSFSRIGRQEMLHTTISMTALVDEVKHQLETALAPEAVEWRIGNLPPVCGDPGMVFSVISNLLGNAVKFSRHRVPACIGIEGWAEDGMNHYQVSDNGEGFDMRHSHKLFQLFQRLHTREEHDGHGIGLALVRRIVTLHGGMISASGQPGCGATFSFTLPAAADSGCHPVIV